MSFQIILIRHGETEWNMQGRLQGHHDSRLTAVGIAQAKKLAQRLKRERFSALYSSDLGRALETAHAIAHLTDHAVIADARLREKNLGILEGLTWAESRRQHPDVVAELDQSPHDYIVPGGESASQMLGRMLTFLDDLAERHPDDRVAAVTHGAMLSALFRHILGIPVGYPRRFHILNTSIHELAKENGVWWVHLLGDVHHTRLALDEVE
jgi:probable phosphoglycerate mutase